MDSLQIGAAAALASIAITGAYLDLRYRRLPNWLCAIGLIAGLGLGYAAGGAAWFGMSALHACLALAAGMGLFAIGAIGGGDAKYYAALAAWFPLRYGALLIVSVSLAGLALLVVWLPLRRWRKDRGAPADDAFRKLPYGVAIATGAILAFSLRPLPF